MGNDLIKALCEKTRDPVFCESQLNPHNERDDVNIDDVAHISMNLASGYATNVKNKIVDMYQTFKDDNMLEVLERLDECKMKFAHVISDMRLAKIHWNDKNYTTVSYFAKECITDLDRCNYRILHEDVQHMGKLLNIVETLCEIQIIV